MANIPLDDLQIDIVVNASKAETAITKLANSLKKLGEFKPDTSKIKEFIHELSAMANESVRIDFLTESLSKLQKALAKFQMPKGLASTMQENIKQSVSPEDALMKVPSTKDVSAMAASFKNIADQVKILDEVGKTATGFYMVVDEVERLAATASGLSVVASNISKVSKTVGSSSGSRGGNTSTTDSLGRGSRDGRVDTENAGSSIEDTGNRTEDAGKKAKEASGRFGGLLSSFKRIAMYRALRSAIRAITQSFSEGIKNLVQWDAAFANTSGALATMTEIKSLAQQIKNTLGAMAMPIIQSLLPALRLAAQALMFIANVINQVVRAFQGYSTYIKAVYKEVDYLGDSLGSAGSKAKELQRILFGFDDLNVLPSENKHGGSGGTGALSGFNDMFEETEIPSSVTNFWKDLKKDFDYWLGDLFTVDFWKGIYDDIVYWFGQAYAWIDENFITPLSTFLGKFHEEEIEPAANPNAKPLTETERFLNGELFKDANSTAAEIQRTMQEYLAKNPLRFRVVIDPETGQPEIVRRELQGEVEKNKPIVYGAKLTVPTNGNNVYKQTKYALAKIDPIGLGTELSPVKNYISTRTETQAQINKKSPLVYKSEVGLPKNQTTVKNEAQTATGKLAAVLFRSSLKTPTNQSTVRSDAQKVADKQNSVAFKSSVNPITGLISGIRNNGQKSASGLIPIAFKSSLNAITGLVAGIRNSGQASANNLKAVLFASALNSLTGLVSGIRDSGQVSASRLNPITFAVSIGTAGLGTVLSNAWWALQNALNKNPLTYATSVGQVGGANATTMQNRKFAIANAYASGGTPDIGTLFWAGESGAEVVATMSNGRTGVMNVGQMEAAVAAGNVDVVNAIYGMANMVVNAVNNKDFDVYMDSAKVGQSVTSYQSNQARRGVAY